MILEAEPLALGCLPARLPNGVEKRPVLKDVDGLLERLKVLGRQQDSSWPAVASHHEALVLSRGSVDEFRQMGLGLREWNRLAHDWSEF